MEIKVETEGENQILKSMQLFYRWGGFQLTAKLQCFDGATTFGITMFSIMPLNVAVNKVSQSLYVVSVC